MKIKSFLSVLLLSVPLMWFTGCGKKKPKETKKMSQVAGRGVPLSGSKKGVKRYGKDLEAFMLDDEESAEPTMLALNGQTQGTWTEDRGAAKSFEPVLFDFDKYSIRPDQVQVVAYDAAKAKSAIEEGKLLKVEGHADQHYVSEIYNLAISQKRAHTMVDQLAQAGVDRNALKPLGFGATRPVVNLPGAKAQENRRAEIVPLTA